jgi:hypothetical protein
VEKLTKSIVEEWLKTVTGSFHYSKILDGRVSPESFGHLRKIMHDLVKERKIKSLGQHDGIYKIIKEIKPVRWHDADESEYSELVFPWSHEDCSSFGLEDAINLSPGDLIVVSGVSNTGKSGYVLNLLGENIDKHTCVLMGNEYTSLDGQPSPKFKRRLKRMTWVEWFNGSGESKFELLPVRSDFEDYVKPDCLNIIDWINLTDQFYQIGKIIEDVKAALGRGLAIVVLQKEEEAKLARGRGFTRDLADVYLTIDPYGDKASVSKWESRLEVGKVKDKKKMIEGRTWAFHFIDGGSNLHNIRELSRCRKCWTKGYIQKVGRCPECEGKGYIDK